MDQLLELVKGFEVQPVAILDIGLTALLIYGLFSLIRGTRAVRLVIGVTVLYVIYVVAQALGLQLLSQILQAGVVLPLSESGVYRERFGTRHRAALGITEQTDAIAVVVSEETGSVSLVERGRIVRDLDEPRLARGLAELLEHNALSAARLPARATALRRTLPLRRPSRARRQSEASPPAAAPAPSPAA